ncbi:uncharacterized protein [Physcomitrium patens]|uniref:Smr domain-containing protein n=1 Tax=Physcomitrium patens TaxID=3218 RepID=A9TSP1_PHYPA|nr:pentatricopeptide repeat-containing protein At2g31400, chloroplastic-like [Physcomitrium patens]PNR52630.1 hypothetical protein PHYPA_009004 [Physcomitrium patens]|eukprot:XP_024378639.1 pentatricopeptide repeat-containing protein At2g31400, chloroplastic-like [Physcomitrella patens]
MASGAGFLSAEAKAASAGVGVGVVVGNHGSAGLKGSASSSRGGRWRPTTRQGGHHGGDAWVSQRVAVTGNNRAGWGHQQPGHQQQTQSASAAATTAGGLNAEFCGRRSTRLVSKFHHGRQKLYMGKHSPEADLAAQEILSAPSTPLNSTALLLEKWSHQLVGLEDFPYLLRELGNRGEWERALQGYEWMVQQVHLRSEWSKLASIMISTLGRLGKVEIALDVFNRAQKAGFGNNVYAYSAMVSAYGRSGRCREALKVFQAMKKAGCKPNLITYNTIIDACGKGGVDLKQALDIFDEMQKEGVEPDRITFNSLIAVCSRGGLWEDSQRVFAEMQRRGIEQDIFTFNTLIDAVCKGGQMELAASIMTTMRGKNISPNVVTYSTMIDGYGKLGCFEEAISLYHDMKESGVRPDRVSYNTLIDIYAKLGRFDDALIACKDMERVGLKADVVTYNALIDAYGKQGKYKDAACLFDKMKGEGLVPNVLTYSALIDSYSKAGMHQDVSNVFTEFKRAGLKPDVVLYSSLIDSCCKCGLVEDAVVLLQEMTQAGIQPNIVTYNSLIDAYGRYGQADKLEAVKANMPNSVQKIGERSMEVVRKPPPSQQNASDHTGVLAAVSVFHEMQQFGLKPNVVTFSAILNACSRCASLQEASVLLEQMRFFDGWVYGIAHGLLMGLREQVWVEAQRLFDEISRMDYATGAAFYNALTDVLWHFGQRQGAQEVVVAAKRRQVWENAWWRSEQQFCLDLHLMSVGAAQAMLHVWLLDLRALVWDGHALPRVLSILTGWGKHSKVAGVSTVKRAVELRLQEIKAPFQVGRYNEGRLVCAGHIVREWLGDPRTSKLLMLQDAIVKPNLQWNRLPDLGSSLKMPQLAEVAT